MKRKLIILSDMWGRKKSEWVNLYMEILKDEFDFKYYDCCELGNIDKSDYSEASLHRQFIEGGIDRAVERLMEYEQERVSILAFSVGGVIAWRYGLLGQNVDRLICVSSTRIRYETLRPDGEIILYFGAADTSQPTKEWFKTMGLDANIIPEKGHEVYIECAVDLANQVMGLF